MKKSLLLLLAICLVSVNPTEAQMNRLLNKVAKSVTGDNKKPAGSSQAENANKDPEPKSACENPELIVDLGGKLKLMYSEISITVRDDGAIMLQDRITSDFYIVKNGTTDGPYKEGDPKLAGFDKTNNNDNKKPTWANNEYISKTGEKYTINFGGKSYGPYAEIQQFKVTKSKAKFAAVIVQNVAVTEADMKRMEEAMKNAKTDQEKMDLSMKYGQEMAQNMQKAGGMSGTMAKLVTNVQGATWDPLRAQGYLNGDIKYDDILIPSYDKIIDLSSKVLITIKPEAGAAEHLFVNTANTKYAYYNYGALTFGDGTTLPDLFNAHLLKSDGATNIAYMYYSPKTNAIMQCKIPF